MNNTLVEDALSNINNAFAFEEVAFEAQDLDTGLARAARVKLRLLIGYEVL